MRTLYIAMELSNKTWKLAFLPTPPAKKLKPLIIDVPARCWPQYEEAIARAKQHFDLESCVLVSCYEAGRDGFWIHRKLVAMGVDNRVVDSSSIEVNRRMRRSKTDNLDARALLKQLKRYEEGDLEALKLVHVPSRQEEDDRFVHRELEVAKKRKTSLSNQIRSHLIAQGIDDWEPCQLHDGVLDELLDGTGQPLMPNLKRTLTRLLHTYHHTCEQIHELESQQNAEIRQADTEKRRRASELTAWKGIGSRSAYMLSMEIGERTFTNRKSAGAFLGLNPTPFASGTMDRQQGISKAGNARLRWLMVELAWLWLRWQPNSKHSKWFQARVAQGSKRARRVAIVALARKLFIDIWRFFDKGVVPPGIFVKQGKEYVMTE